MNIPLEELRKNSPNEEYKDGYRAVYFYDNHYSIGTYCKTIEGFMIGFAECEPIMFDDEIPVNIFAIHGALIYNCYREGINAMPGTDLYLRNFAQGGAPMYYFHHLFHPDWTGAIGWNHDLKYTTHENLVKDAAKIKRATDDMARIAPLQTEFVNDYVKHSDTLTQTVYSNGKSVWANYGDTEAKTPEGKTIPAKDFIVA